MCMESLDIINFHQVADDSFSKCQKVVAELMDQYENQRHSPHRQRLVWKLSNRTLRQLRPTDKFTTRLPTIVEMQGPSHPPIIRPRYVCSVEDLWLFFCCSCYFKKLYVLYFWTSILIPISFHNFSDILIIRCLAWTLYTRNVLTIAFSFPERIARARRCTCHLPRRKWIMITMKSSPHSPLQQPQWNLLGNCPASHPIRRSPPFFLILKLTENITALHNCVFAVQRT